MFAINSFLLQETRETLVQRLLRLIWFAKEEFAWKVGRRGRGREGGGIWRRTGGRAVGLCLILGRQKKNNLPSAPLTTPPNAITPGQSGPI